MPGREYYRLPVFGFLKEIYDQTVEPLEDEGYLCRGEGEWDILGLLLVSAVVVWTELPITS